MAEQTRDVSGRAVLAMAFATALVASACVDSPTEATDNTAQGIDREEVALQMGAEQKYSKEVRHWLRDLRHATRPFRNFDRAATAGYGAQLSPCVASPAGDGAMGFHYGNLSLMDGEALPLQPEVILYEPQGDGSLKMVGIEWIIPYAAWGQEAPPSLLGVTFDASDHLESWTLHVWTERRNPAGVFMPFNSKVSCAAQAS